MSHVGVQKQQGNIVMVCGNFPANTGFHRAHIINSFLNTVPDKLVGTHSVSLPSQCTLTLRGRRGAQEWKKQRSVEVSQLFLTGTVGLL